MTPLSTDSDEALRNENERLKRRIEELEEGFAPFKRCTVWLDRLALPDDRAILIRHRARPYALGLRLADLRRAAQLLKDK